MSPSTQPTDRHTASPAVMPSDADLVVTDPRRQRMILIAMCIALVGVVGSVSGLNVAQRDMAVSLGASQSTLLWIINGYTMVLAALLLPIGAIGDRYGRKTVLLSGLTLFTIANISAAFANTTTLMLLARLAAGAGAAMIMPVTLSVITSSFPSHERAKAVGVWAGFAGVGGILGLFFSSAMVDWFSWRWLFAMPIVVSAIAFVLTSRFVANSREHHAGRFDVGGSFLSALAIGMVVMGIHEGPEKGWSAPITLVGLGVGLVALVGFIVWELRHEQPLLDVRVFSNRSLSSGSLNLLILFAAMFGLFLVLIQFLQAVAGFSALRASAGLLPMAAVMMPLSTFAPRIVERIGIRPTLIVGTGLFGLGSAVMAIMVSADGGYLSILPGLMILGAGMGLAMTPSTTAITESLPVEKQGVASALNDTVRELGGALGVAVLGSLLNSGYRSSIASTANALPEAVQGPVREGIGTALAASAQLGSKGAAVAEAAKVAFVDGWRISMWVCVALAATGLAVLIFRGPKDGELNVLEASELDDAELHAGELEELLASSGTLTPVS